MEKFEFRALFSLPSIIKEITLGDTQHTLGDVRIYRNITVGKHHGRNHLANFGLQRIILLKWILKRTECDGVNSIKL
jgi:hypothetical protein